MPFHYPLLFGFEPADVEFEQRAKEMIHVEGHVRAAPEEVYDHVFQLRQADTWLTYFCNFVWRSANHQGPGCVYDETFNFMSIRVRTLIDERGARWNASIDRCSVPFARMMGENVRFNSDGNGGTHVIWQIYYDPPLLLRPLAGIGNAFFRRMLQTSLKKLDALSASGVSAS